MNLFQKITNRLSNAAAQKIEDSAETFVNKGIDHVAAKAAETIGAQFGRPAEFNPTANNNKRIINDYRVYQNDSQPEMPFNPPVQPIQQHPQGFQQPFYNPYSTPDFQQVQLSFTPPVINRLDEEQVKRLASYKTNLFFQVNKIGKNTIRFAGLKLFSYKIEESRAIVEAFEKMGVGDDKAYKKAKFKIEKVAELQSMKEDSEQEKIFRDFVADVIFDELKQKNERGELQMPGMMEIAFQSFGLHAWQVFTPDISIEAYFSI